jgi:hypothetical protein
VRKWPVLFFALPIATLAFVAASAYAADSSYSSIAEKLCRKFDVLKIDGTEYAVSRVCAGRGGYKIFVDEEDLRETLTVGTTMRQAGKEPAAQDRFGVFNRFEDRIEWRNGTDEKPYALIAGWSFADNDHPDATGRPGSVRFVVVMRLPPGPVCKVAYIDRAANDDAEELARQAADSIARNFRCGTDTARLIGKSGPASEAMSRLAEPEKPKP